MILVCFSFIEATAQLHDNIWFVGQEGEPIYSRYELNFSEFPVKPKQNLNLPSFRRCSNTFCDSLGNLFCYSNGISIWNKNYEIMEGGEIINPGPIRDGFKEVGLPIISGIFLPLPENDSLLYYFHSASDYPPNNLTGNINNVLYCSIINLKSNNGLGKVIKANIPILVNPIGSPVANRHANGRDWWILVTDFFGTNYFKFLLTPSGITELDEQFVDFPDRWQGHTSFSPDGSMYVNHNGGSGFNLYDFDRCDGNLTPKFNVKYNPVDTLGFFWDVSFSPNNQYLYTSIFQITRRDGRTNYDMNRPYLIQYDLLADDIGLSADTIGRRDSLPNLPVTIVKGVAYNGLQLAPDGKIYTFTNNTKMHSIQEPNRKGKESRLLRRYPEVDHGLEITRPYYPNYRLGPLDNSPCDTLGIDNHPRANYRWENWDTLNELHIEFADLSYYEPAEWLWEFEDLGTSRDTNPAFTFPAPGIYEVCLTVSNVNSTHTTCKNVPVGEGVVDIDYVFEENEPTVFPNPTANAFQVYLPTAQSVEVSLFDAAGRLVLNQADVQSGEQVDVSLLPKGIYFYHFRNEEKEVMHTGKLVVVR